jgi:RND family efflux transporter MFP subunit
MNGFRWGLFASMLVPLWAEAAQPLGCLIEPIRVSEVGSPVIGVIENTLVERGERVSAGQPLAILRSDVERQSVAVAQSRAQAVGELQAAEANAVLARQKLARAQDLANQQFISSQALEQAKAETLVAENRLAQAREQRGVYMREHELAQAQLGLRTIRSPINGVVVDRYLSSGERVEERPVYRVAMVNPLRVEVVLPSSFYTQVKLGMPITVTPEFPGATARTAKVTLVDKVIDGASNTFRVRLELPNPDYALPAGLRCKADMGGVAPVPPHKAGSTAAAGYLPQAPTPLPLRGSPVLVTSPRAKH